MQVGSRPSVSVSVSHDFFVSIRHFMYNAGRIREESGINIVQLMDDLYKVSLALVRSGLAPHQPMPALIGDAHNAELVLKLIPDGFSIAERPDFLDLACRAGVTPYVAAYAPYRTRRPSCLILEALGNPHQSLHHCCASNASVSTVQCLLGKGYSSGDEHHHPLAWELLVKVLAEVHEADEEAAWLQLAERAFRAGERWPFERSEKVYILFAPGGLQPTRSEMDTASAKLTELHCSMPQSETLPQSEQLVQSEKLPSRLRMKGRKLKRLFEKSLFNCTT